VTKQLRKKHSKIGPKKVARARRRTPKKIVSAVPRQLSDLDPGDTKFAEVLALIENARSRAYQAINSDLVALYWQLGEYISLKIENAEWGDGVVDELATALARRYSGLRGFARPNLFRMRQLYEAYRGNKKVSALLRQLPWTHHMLILSQAKPPETREFYILAAIRERWSSRELERQIQSAAILRSAPAAKKVSPAVAQIHPTAIDELKNAYSLEFLSMQGDHSEADLHGALLRNLGRFITELGRDFCFVGSEYPVQVGNQDFAIDLVFFHRALQCLVAFELKVEKFKPADLGQLSFYVEALDRDVKKAHERPSIGVLLCATKDDEVVEYALARTASPTLVAEYQTMLPPKAVMRRKLHELYAQLSVNDPDEERGKKRSQWPPRSRPSRRALPSTTTTYSQCGYWSHDQTVDASKPEMSRRLSSTDQHALGNNETPRPL
jgi:predicted nuclease of restriction endonuclease-like (RecB) superfamily